MLYREDENPETPRLIYTALILPDKDDRQQQRNISILLEVPLKFFEKRTPYFRFLIDSKLIVGKKAPPRPDSQSQAGKPGTKELSLQPVEKTAAPATGSNLDKKPAPSLRAFENSSSSDSDEREEYDRLLLAAQGQKLVIYSIIINFIFRGFERNLSLPGPLSLILAIIIAAFTINGVLKICSSLGKGQNYKISIMVVSMFPLINLIILVFLNTRATKILRKAGHPVGLLGAKF